MYRIQMETGPRNVQTDTYGGRHVEVVTGYHALSDKWPIHIYIDGKKLEGQWLADRMSEAFDEGFRLAQMEIDRTAGHV